MDEKEFVKCCQVTCNSEATHKVYWPGESEPKMMCIGHAKVADATAQAMGFGLVIEPPLHG